MKTKIRSAEQIVEEQAKRWQIIQKKKKRKRTYFCHHQSSQLRSYYQYRNFEYR